ncbi:CoA transferase [Streptomyces sp. NPDC048420]|uniref:CoA transferase n=1 Tax=Streptomyces sp. NPDC048420 TaxID=3155755 RepID=UPI00342C2C8D
MAVSDEVTRGMLGDVRVLDLAEGGAGSLAAAILGDYGAEVLKVVARDPRREPTDSLPDWLVRNRSKTLVHADASAAADRAEIGRLADSADVVVVDTLDRLTAFGVHADSLGTRRLVVLTPPYLPDGAPWSGEGESAELLSAIFGLSAYQASYPGSPVDAVYPYLVQAHGVWTATCVVAALVEYRYTGLGQLLTVSGFNAAAVFGDPVITRPEDEPDPDRGIGPEGLNPMYTRYQAADGEWVFVGGLGPKFANLVIDIVGLRELLDDPRIGGRIERLWHIDNSRWVMKAFQERFLNRPAAAWVELLERGDVPCVQLARREEWFRSEQMKVMDQRISLFDPVLGGIHMTGAVVDSVTVPAAVSATSGAITVAAAQWHVTPGTPATARPAADGGQGPLAGYRAAVSGSYVAGPYVGRLLAELGVDVIKVEPLVGDPWRMQGFSLNRGYRSIAIDLSGQDGKQALGRVLTSCDVVVDNFRLGVTKRLGMSHEDLAEDRKDIVTVSVTAYGERGPLAHKPGYDVVVQAAAGMMLAQGGDDEPVPYSVPPNDMTTGVCGTLASVLGIYHRAMTGEGQHLSTSLATTSVFLQSADLVEYADRPAGRWGGRDYAGPGPTDRFYPVRDGYVRLQTAVMEPEKWRAAGIDLDDTALRSDPVTEISRVLASCTRESALAKLTAAGVPAVPARRASEVATDAGLHARNLLGMFTATDGRRFVTNDRLAGFSRTAVDTYFMAPGLGEHSVELLAESGATAEETESLIRSGVVIDGSPIDITYLPPYR